MLSAAALGSAPGFGGFVVVVLFSFSLCLTHARFFQASYQTQLTLKG